MEITRERKTAGERKSAGWATTAIRTKHRSMDRGEEIGRQDWKVKYYFKEADDLATRMAQRLGGEQIADRDKLIVRYDPEQQKWVDADSRIYDTNDADVLSMTWTNKKHDIQKELKQLPGGDEPGAGLQVVRCPAGRRVAQRHEQGATQTSSRPRR